MNLLTTTNLFSEILTGAGNLHNFKQMFCCRSLTHAEPKPRPAAAVSVPGLCNIDFGLSFSLTFYFFLCGLLACCSSSRFWLNVAEGIFLLLCNGSAPLPLSRGMGRNSYAHVAGKLLMLGEVFPFCLSLAVLYERLRGCLDHL